MAILNPPSSILKCVLPPLRHSIIPVSTLLAQLLLTSQKMAAETDPPCLAQIKPRLAEE
jgi:hypothetical protein